MPLVGAAVLVGLEGLALMGLAILELVHLHAARVALAVTTALFFLVMGAGLLACARGLAQVRSWARGPVVAVQLIALLLSFSFWGGQTKPGAVVLRLVSVGRAGRRAAPRVDPGAGRRATEDLGR